MSNIYLIILFGISAVTATNEQYVEAAVGTSVTFPCQAVHDSSTVVWHHYPFGAILPKTVCLDDSVIGTYRDRFSLTRSRFGEFNLSISGISLQDSGRFICMSETQIGSFELIVLESYPSPQSCASNSTGTDIIGRNSCEIEPDIVSLNCSLRYQGNVLAVLEWRSTSGNSVNPTVKTIDNGKTVSTLILKADQLKSGAYFCFVKYLNSSFVSNFNCTLLNNVTTLFNQTREYNPDCNTQTVPCPTNTTNCSYTWTNNKSEEISTESTLPLQGLQAGQYICKADCLIRKKHKCTFVPVKLNITCGHGKHQVSDSGIIAGIVIGVLVAVAIILGVSVFRCRLYRKNKPKNTEAEEQPMRMHGNQENQRQ